MKNLLLIGGSYGIGREIITLSEDNNVFVASRTSEGIDTSKVTHITFDAALDEFDTSNLPDFLDGFVYCPGTINLKPFKRIKVDTFKEDLNINFIGMVKVLHQILPIMRPGSSIVLFSTIAVQTGMPFHTSVAASKGAIEGFARSLAAEYAPNIRVNVIAPSLTDTPLASRLLNSDIKREKMGDRHPLKRVGTANDIAKTAVFLLSENASWITGQTFGVDGGLSSLNLN